MIPILIRKIDQRDLDIIYQDLENCGLLLAARYLRSYWSKDGSISGMTLAIDEEHGAYLWALPMSREDSSFRYLFSMSGQAIILQMLSTEVFCIQRRKTLAVQYLETAKNSIRSMLRTGGFLLREGGKHDEIEDVPNAQFVEQSGSAK